MSEIEPLDSSKEAQKERFFEELESMGSDAIYSDWDAKTRKTIKSMFSPNKVKTGMMAAIPLLCHGDQCPFAPSCPLLEKGIAPENSSCPIEASMVQTLFKEYVDELEVDVTRMVEVSMLRDLIDQEVQHLRKTWLLRQEHFIQENVIGVDESGRVVTQKQLHHAVGYEDKILARKDKLRKALLATRESKAKAGDQQMDKAQAVSNLMREARQLQIERDKALRRELGTTMQDDYIEAEMVDDDDDD